MTPSEKLLLAQRYVDQAQKAIAEAAGNGDPYARTDSRRFLREHVQAARELLAGLERDHPEITVPFVTDEGTDTLLSVAMLRMWAYCVEAEVMARCYQDWSVARDLAECAVAIDPEVAHPHALVAWFAAEGGDFQAALAAMERAVSLEPDNLLFKQALNDARRDAERAAAPQETITTKSIWNPKSWLG
jgi:tetratricopeptide (TPR) repeat protein